VIKDKGKFPLNQAARRTEDDPFFLGSYLAEFRSIRRLPAAAVAKFLECSDRELPRLSLCRAPRKEPRGFREDTIRIASFVRANPSRLASLVREVSAVRAFRATTSVPDAGPALLAARDRRRAKAPDPRTPRRKGPGGTPK